MRFATAFIIIVLAFYGLYSLFRPRGEPGPAQKFESVALAPISRGEILSEFRLITVERQYRIPVIGRSYKPMPDTSRSGVLGQIARDMMGGRDSIPGTTTNLVYEMVTTVTMGIDLAKLRDEDIQNNDTVTTLTLPNPEVIAVVHDPTKSQIFSKDSPTLPYLDNSAALLEELQRTGTIKHRVEAEGDELLQARAQDEARRQLKGLLEKVHPGRDVQILFKSDKIPLPKE